MQAELSRDKYTEIFIEFMEDVGALLSNSFFSPLPVAEEFIHVLNPLKVKGMDLPRAQDLSEVKRFKHIQALNTSNIHIFQLILLL